MPEKSDPSDNDRNRDQADGELEEDSAPEVGLRSIASLERLRDRVQKAADEMMRLRGENASLMERVKELETRPAVDPSGTFLAWDHDPEQLKQKIGSFIEAIDAYLERERSGS